MTETIDAEVEEKHGTLAEAFVAAQGEFPAVERDGENPHFKSKFTTLGHLLGKVRPVLNKHGLSVIQLPARGEDGEPVLRTLILHTSGEQITADAPLLLSKRDPQGQGSAITYMRRYALASALGISDQDDDGNAGVDVSGESFDSLPSERVEELGRIIRKTLDLNASRVSVMFGAIGGNAPADPDDNGQLRIALGALTGEQATKLEDLLSAEADRLIAAEEKKDA